MTQFVTGTVASPSTRTPPRAFAPVGASRRFKRLEAIASDDPFTRLAKMFLLLDVSARRSRALEMAGEVRDEFAISVLYLLGDPRAAREAAERRVEVTRSWKLSPLEHAVHRYQAGLIDAAALIDQFDESEISKSRAYFHIGLRKLAAGTRDEALESLEKSANSVAYTFPEVEWARALTARLSNPSDSWWDWIPSKPIGTDAK